jgi:glycosyltransferase involved in cell wall biosynthesis
MRPLRLLAIIEAYTITGPAKNLLEFARHAPQAGVELVIATFVRDQADTLFIRTARQRGIRIETVQETGAWDPKVLPSLRDVVTRVQPDVIQTHAVKSHFLARRAGLPSLAPWVAFHHGYTWPTTKARLYNELDRWSLRTAVRVLTVSDPFRKELVARGVPRYRIDIIHNAIAPTWGQAGRNPETARAVRESLGIPLGAKVILIVGRLSKEKDHITLLEALRRIPKHLNPHLVMVGEGPERPVIEAKILELGLGERTTFTGQRDSAEPFYGIADVAVLSSLSEGSPNALLEAMAAGVPAVATRVGGVPEIVTDGDSAYLVDTKDPDSLADRITHLLRYPDVAERMVARSHGLIAANHAPEVRVRRLADIYEGIRKP